MDVRFYFTCPWTFHWGQYKNGNIFLPLAREGERERRRRVMSRQDMNTLHLISTRCSVQFSFHTIACPAPERVAPKRSIQQYCRWSALDSALFHSLLSVPCSQMHVQHKHCHSQPHTVQLGFPLPTLACLTLTLLLFLHVALPVRNRQPDAATRQPLESRASGRGGGRAGERSDISWMETQAA